jgi:hypothetical protein
MVNSSDFASAESGLSGAIKVWMYGKILGNSALFFVNSGTGSLAGHDIIEVGPSKFGMYTVAVDSTALSDSSNAFYDAYIFMASATGAANQILIFSGVRATVSDLLSTMNSQFGVISNYLSNASAYLSGASHLLSQIVGDTSGLAGADASDIASAVWTHATGLQLSSRVLLVQSDAQYASTLLSSMQTVLTNTYELVSDVDSALTSQFVYSSGALSQLLLAGAATPSAIAAKVWSDYQSKVGQTPSQVYSHLSNTLSQILVDTTGLNGTTVSDLVSATWAHAVAVRVDSRLLVTQSAAVNANSQLVAGTFALGASNLSALASAVWAQHWTAHSAASSFGSAFEQLLSSASTAAALAFQANSRALDLQAQGSTIAMMVGTVDSALASQYSDVRSAIGNVSVTIGASDISDIASATAAAIGFTPSAIAATVWSDFQSKVGSTVSGLFSQLAAGGATPSAIAAKVWSDYQSKVGQTPSQVYSFLSNTLSQVLVDTTGLNGADASDFASAVWAHAVGTQVNSRILRIQSDAQYASALLSGMSAVLDATYELVSDVDSALTSQVAVTSQYLSQLHSDLKSAVGNVSVALSASDISDIASATAAAIGFTPSGIAATVWSDFQSKVGRSLSDAFSELFALSDAVSTVYSVAQQTNSRALALQAQGSTLAMMVGDVDSALDSQFGYLSAALSDAHSDLKSAIGNVSVALSASDISDIASATAAAIGFTPSAIADKVWSDFGSKVGRNVSDAFSELFALSDAVSNTYSAALLGASRALVLTSRLSDFDSRLVSDVSDLRFLLIGLSGMVSDVDSALTSRFNALDTTGVPLTSGTLSDLRSAIAAATVAIGPSELSDIASAVRTTLASDLSDILSVAQQTNSRTALLQSMTSDVQSLAVGLSATLGTISGLLSDTYSGVEVLSQALAAGVTLTGAGAEAVADAVLDRDLAGGGSGSARTVRQALRALRNKTSIAGGVLTVTAEDDVTPAWTAAVTTAPGDPLTSIDPLP